MLIASSLYSKITLSSNKIIRVSGPAKIVVDEGCIRILGMDIRKGEDIVINRYRSYAVKALEDSVISIILGEGGSIEEPMEGEEVIDVWEKAAHEIIDRRGKIVIIGTTDSGKTSLSLLISNIAIDRKLKVALIDGDIGQNDLAPPGFVALKIMKHKSIWLRQFKGDIMRFIGYLTPSTSISMSRVISSILELVVIAEKMGNDIIIVNTDGWFGDISSIEYKSTLIKSIKPQSLVVLDENFCKAFDRQFHGTFTKVYCLPKPRVVKERNRVDRRELRKVNYKTYFEHAKKLCFDIEKLFISNSCLFNGIELDDEELQKISQIIKYKPLAASKYEDSLILLLSDNTNVSNEDILKLKTYMNINDIYILKPSMVKGILTALVNEEYEEVGVGIIDSIDIDNKRLCILTEYGSDIKGIIIGRIKLDENFEDKGKISRCPL